MMKRNILVSTHSENSYILYYPLERKLSHCSVRLQVFGNSVKSHLVSFSTMNMRPSIFQCEWSDIPNFALITGASSTGKSYILNKIYTALGDDIVNVVYRHSHKNPQASGSNRTSSSDTFEIIPEDTAAEPIAVIDGIIQKYDNLFSNLKAKYETVTNLNEVWSFCRGRGMSEDIFLNRLLYSSSTTETNLIGEFVTEKLGLHPRDEMNKLLSDNGFAFQIAKSQRHDPIEFQRSGTGKTYRYQELSSGEKFMLELFSWLYYFRLPERLNGNILSKSVDILILDEPDAHLDSNLCEKFLRILEKEFVANRHIQVLLVSHRIDTLKLFPQQNAIYTFVVKNPGDIIIRGNDYSNAERRMCEHIEVGKRNVEAATFLLSGNLSVIPNHKIIMVENDPDVKFYSFIYHKLKSTRQFPRCSRDVRLQFCMVGVQKIPEVDMEKFDELQTLLIEARVDEETRKKVDAIVNYFKNTNDIKSGRTQVNSKVSMPTYEFKPAPCENGVIPEDQLCIYRHYFRSDIVHGQVDNDGKGALSNRNVGDTSPFYSIDNLIFFPLNFFFYDLKDLPTCSSNELNLGIAKGVSGWREGLKLLEEVGRPLSSEKQKCIMKFKEFIESPLIDVALWCGITVRYPQLLIQGNGHIIENSVQLLYPTIPWAKKNFDRINLLGPVPSRFLPLSLVTIYSRVLGIPLSMESQGPSNKRTEVI